MDGTGGTATISGTAGGATNSLYRALFTGQEGALIWQLVGTRIGDGTIAVGQPARVYWLWYATSVNGGATDVSQVVQKALTDTTYLSVRMRCINAISDRMKLLDLTDLRADRIVIRNFEDDPVQQFPLCIVCPGPTPDQYTGGTNIRDDLGYDVQVLFQDRSDGGTEAPIAKWSLWREKGERAFRNQRLPGVDEIMWCDIEPARMIDPSKPIYQQIKTGFSIRCRSREVRGIEV